MDSIVIVSAVVFNVIGSRSNLTW